MLNGVSAGDQSGTSVSRVGDVNGDGIQDIIIGANLAASSAGKTYVVFGKRGPWVSSLNLSSLNGTNGFELDGVTSGDDSGSAVSGVGDVNGDTIQDFIIGAPQYPSGSGRAYVLFGKTTNWPSSILFSTLNGTNGFEIDGEAVGDYLGNSVSGAGDVNGDGVADLLIGAYGSASYTGKSYVIFGKRTPWSSPLSVSALNGTNGFRLDGISSYDNSGISVSTAGDVNGDGIADLLIGAYVATYPGGPGKAYVVFGSQTGFPAIISLSSLNGMNGFELDGITTNDNTGYSVKTALDVNADDIADIIIGASGASSYAGKTYVVFGKNSSWTSPISLSSLNGTNGFELDGEPNDNMGFSVSNAGDVNGDGIDDMVMGASYPASTQPGKTYVVFGKSTAWTSPILISTLDGTNGFELAGVAAGDHSGYAVSGAGDVNGDGIQDLLIGAYGASSRAGNTYVVFGDSPPVLVNNSLTLSRGERISLSFYNLAAYDLNHANSSLVFGLSDVVAGQFETLGNPDIPLANFTQFQVTNGSVQFIHDGSSVSPAYNVTVTTSGFAFVGPMPANVRFNPTSVPSAAPTIFVAGSSFPTSLPSANSSLIVANNTLIINQGQSVVITTSNLAASDIRSAPASLNFTLSNIQHGQFSLLNQPTAPITRFPQSQIAAQQIQFTQDGTPNAPSFSVSVSDGALFNTGGPQPATIYFGTAPILVNNPLLAGQGQTTVLTTASLNVTNTQTPPSNIFFTVNNVRNGYFELLGFPGVTINTFTLQEIINGEVAFVQDGTANVPTYVVQLTTPEITLASQSAPITLISVQLTANQMSLNQGQSLILNATNFNATNLSNAPNPITYVPSEVQKGNFTYRNGTAATGFTQDTLNAGLLVFTPDGTTNAPACEISVGENGNYLSPQTTLIRFNRAPYFIQNSLGINQDQTVTLTSNDLRANDPDDATSSLIFIVSEVQHGEFTLTSNPNTPITTFVQSQVTAGQIQFIQDGSANTPSYSVAVSDGKMINLAGFQAAF